MTEERSCGTCGHYVSDMCVRPGGCCFHHSKWQPIVQEKPMENKVIFESEEQFVNFWEDLTGVVCLPGTREKIKQKGYIRKTALEEAEEYEKHFARIMDLGLSCTIKDLEYSMRIIEMLKSEIARVKK
jgi:hypothetical protein